ncbi:unnamed protein product [Rhizophagus irregularis]|nr:unnamed protein product [Rhizophagus irregularis]
MDPKVTELSSKDQNDLSVNSVGKTEEPNNDKSLTDDLRQETKESRSSSSSISQLPEQQTVDYMQTSSEESSTEQPEDGSRKRGKKSNE